MSAKKPHMTTVTASFASKARLYATAARVGAFALYDKIANPNALSREDTPWSADAITVEWLNHAIGCGASGTRVVSFNVGRGSAGTSVRRAIKLHYSDRKTNLPTNMFAKTCPTFLTRMANSVTGTMISEGNFYRILRPELSIEAPVGYHSSFSPASFRSVHLLEDLVATKNATFCNPRTEISRDKAEQIVRLLATYHGHFYGDLRLQAWPWLKSYPSMVLGWRSFCRAEEESHSRLRRSARGDSS